jgi:hypothetical protein
VNNHALGRLEYLNRLYERWNDAAYDFLCVRREHRLFRFLNLLAGLMQALLLVAFLIGGLSNEWLIAFALSLLVVLSTVTRLPILSRALIAQSKTLTAATRELDLQHTVSADTVALVADTDEFKRYEELKFIAEQFTRQIER